MTNEQVVQHFKNELARNNMKIDSVDKDGNYHIFYKNIEYSISLANVSLNAIRDNSFEPINALVQTISSANQKYQIFKEISEFIFPSIESNVIEVGNSLSIKLTEQTDIRFVIFKNNQLQYIDSEDLKKWEIEISEIKKYAYENLNIEYLKTKVVSTDIDGHLLYYFDSTFPGKSTLLFSKDFYLDYSKKIGELFYAVMPTRDFCYFFAEKDKDYFFRRIGSTVKDEYNNSGYKITTEVIEISKTGMEAIGKY